MNELAASTLPFLQTLAENRSEFLTKAFNLLTYLGDEKLFVVIALIVFWCFSKRGGQYLLTAGFGLSSVGQSLKMLFRVPRPWHLGNPPFEGSDPVARGTQQFDGVLGKVTKALGTGADGWSFPSGHTLISMGTYGGLAAWFRSGWVKAIGIFLVILIPFTRMYLGVHTPLDIISALLLGIIAVLVLKPVFTKGSQSRIRAVLIGNVVLTAVLLVVAYLTTPKGLEGEDIHNYASGIKNLWQLIGATLAVVVGFEADERWLHFETKAVWWAQLLKIIGGSVIVLALQTLIKKIFGYSSDALTLENMTRMGIISCLANLVAVSAAMAAWPMTFKWFSSLGQKKE